MQNQAQNEVSFFAPVCQVCKSQDESLRAVSYPLIFSVVFATFRRAFSGVFCAKHQRRYHILASLITSLFGWLGIPFGFVWTPFTLFKLARGGIVNVEESLQILNLVADKQLRTGDTKGAIRCLEESLKFQDNAEIRGKLTRLYSQNRNTTDVYLSGPIRQFLVVSILLAAAVMSGLTVGLLETLIIYLLSPFVGGSNSIFVAILSWLPTVTLLFLEVLFVRFMLRWTLQKGRITSTTLGTVLAVCSTFLASYSILAGQAILRNLQGLLTIISISRSDGLFALRSVLTHGGVDVLINHIEQGYLSDTIFGVLFASGIFLSLYAGTEMSLQMTRWQNRLFQLRNAIAPETDQSPIPAWLALSSISLGIAFIVALLYPGRFVNIEKAYGVINLGISEMDQNHYAEAAAHFHKAVDLWDTSAINHMFLGVAYYSQDHYEQGMEELDTSLKLDPNNPLAHLGRGYNLTQEGRYREALAEFKYLSESQPEWGLPHAVLAVTYYTLDEMDLAEQELQTALAHEKDDAQASSIIASYYFQTLDFKKAEEHILKAIKANNNGDDYVALARIYVSQNKFDEAEKVIAEASRQGAAPISVYLAKLRSAESQNDLNTARAILSEAIKLYPNDSDLLSESSYLLFQQDQVDKSAADAERAVQLNPYNAFGYIEEAFAYHAQGKLDQALQAAEQGVSLAPKQDRAHYILGLCYMDLGMKKEAAAEFETFLKLYWERPLVKEYKENALIYLEQLK